MNFNVLCIFRIFHTSGLRGQGPDRAPENAVIPKDPDPCLQSSEIRIQSPAFRDPDPVSSLPRSGSGLQPSEIRIQSPAFRDPNPVSSLPRSGSSLQLSEIRIQSPAFRDPDPVSSLPRSGWPRWSTGNSIQEMYIIVPIKVKNKYEILPTSSNN